MGQINYNPELDDDYSSEVIRLARERSPDIDEWITTERYLRETTEDNLSPLWLRNRCIINICRELGEMGIQIQKDPDLVCDEPKLVYAVLMLRKKFNDDDLFELFRDHRDLFNTIREDLNGESLVNIIAWCRENLPLDEGWALLGETLDENPGIFDGETSKFVDDLRQILEQVDNLGEPDVTVELDPDLVLRYIQVLSKRAELVKKLANQLWSRAGAGDYERQAREKIINRIVDSGFEKELGSRECMMQNLEMFGRFGTESHDAVMMFLDKVRPAYKHKWPHCLEYYFGEEHKTCPDSMVAVMLATLIVDSPSRSMNSHAGYRALSEVEDQLGTEACNKLREMFESMLKNLVDVLELNYAAQ